MGSPRVVPEKPIDELQVEGVHIVPQERTVLHNEVVGDRSVEPLDERVHLGASGVRVEVREAEESAGLFEETGKLAPVVSLELVDEEGTDLDDSSEEVGGARRGVARALPPHSRLPLNINGGEDVPLDAVDEADDGVELHAPLHLPAELLPLEYRGFCVIAGLRLEGELSVLGQEVALLEVTNDPANVRLGD